MTRKEFLRLRRGDRVIWLEPDLRETPAKVVAYHGPEAHRVIFLETVSGRFPLDATELHRLRLPVKPEVPEAGAEPLPLF